MARSTTRARTLATAVGLVLVLGACGGGNSNSAGGSGGGGGNTGGPVEISSGGDPDPGPADVSIQNFRYEDETFTVAAGSSVQWVNEGSAPHTVTSESFNSGTIRTAHGFAHQFDDPGEYEYWCSNHESMTGTIIVE